MNRLIELEAEVKKRWADDPAGDLCLKLIDFMSEEPEDQLRMLTLYSIGKIVGRTPLDQDVLRAVTILVSTKIHALEKRLLFIDDDEQEYELDREEIDEVERTGVFVHPHTGEEIDDPETKLVPFFVPSDNFLRIKAGQDG